MQRTLHQVIQRVHFAHGSRYDKHAGSAFADLYRRVAEQVAAGAPTGGVVLDAGCGSGRLALQIAERRPDLRVRGVDLEQGMIDVATRHAEREGLADRVEFTVADLARLPLPDASVDLAVSTASLHHWTDVQAVITSLDRVLRPGCSMWIYDLRLVPAGKVRAASSTLGRRVDRSLLRTGRLPVALYERLAVDPR
jgi:ubiquinone/menaquinone biosynthesis C-methylase UbiE